MAMRPGTMGAAAPRAPLVLGTLVSGGVSDSVGVGVEAAIILASQVTKRAKK